MEGIAKCNCPQDDKKFSINYCARLPLSRHTGSLSSSSRTHRLVLDRLGFINLWTITTLIVIGSISVVSVSDAASIVVKSSDNNNMSLLPQKNKIKSPTPSIGTSSSGSEDTEFSQQPEVNSPLHVAQCRATCLQKFNNRLDGNNGKTLAATTTPCFNHTDCFTCWKSCEVLESLASWTSLKGKGDDDKVGSTKKSKSLRTMCSHSPRLCLSGCQQACGFMMMRMNEPMSGPVVATKRENVLHISSGKIEWPQEPRGKNDMKLADLLNPQYLVYVLIQQYPDLKWKQIIQTTDTSVEISKRLSTEMANKLRNVRVLVVSPNGLVSIYYPQQKTQEPSIKKEEPLIEKSEETTTALATDAGKPTPAESSSSEPHEILATEDYKTEEIKVDNGQDLWELKRVSLIHQKSLVITELTWNPVKYSEDQEYLITWELDGGGLKGHLVTDSTTVSLSLWPNTVYHIMVELFEREEEEEEDGEQDQGDEDSSSKQPKSKSFPLTVDTSEASYPLLEKPSALSKESFGGHKSVTEFLNVTLLLTISSAALLVLGSLLLALSWHNMVRQRRRCSRDPQLLQDTDDSTNPDQETKHSYESPSVAIISPAQLVYPSEKVYQEPQRQQQWSKTSVPQSHTHPSSCWWQNLSTRESNNHYHINNSTNLTSSTTNTPGTRMYLPPSNNDSLPGIQK